MILQWWGNDVYIAGEGYNANGILVAKYWKNGVLVNLRGGVSHSSAKSIAVANNNVYVAGYAKHANGQFVATYWKNGIAVNLASTASRANSITVAVTGVGTPQ